ncbi:MAG: T9SS type A sorting domain-containing protein, partial [Calditrichaeota bacterium]|nr:T9SS type A sorting domain-containing protein [Calditrichota bacterium]
IDPAAQTVIHSQSVTFGITTVAVSGGNKAYFSTYSEGVLVYDLDSYSFERDENNPLPGGPAVAFDRDDAAYIGDFARDSVYVYDPSHLRQHAFLVGDGPVSLAIFDPAPSGLADGDDSAPEAFALYQNYPNPFNPATNFGFRISDFGFVNLNIFDTTGRKVTKLLAQEMAPGEYELQWDGRDDTGAPVASGVYFYQLSAGGQSAVRRMVLLR